LSNGVFRPPSWLRQYISPEQRRKLIKDYIRAGDAYRRASEEGRWEGEELIRLGLIPADPKKSEQ
jgi:hypothetical protein